MAFGFFNKIKEGLEKTRKSFVKNVETVIIGYAEIDDDFLDDLEAVMLTSDLGPKTTEYLMSLHYTIQRLFSSLALMVLVKRQQSLN